MASSDDESNKDNDEITTVRKVKTAFLCFQGDQLSKIRAELGLSMGDAMTEVSVCMYSIITTTAIRAIYLRARSYPLE